MATRSTPTMRAQPVQERGERRMEQILDAAAELVTQTGYDALTLTAVADRSGSAIGSLYRYFSNKEQLIAALVDRMAVALRESAGELEHPPVTANPEAFARWYVEALGEIIMRNPAFPALIVHLGENCEPVEEQAMAPVRAYLKARAPRLSKVERDTVSRVVLELVKIGLELPSHVRGATRTQAQAETRLLIAAYLTQRAGRR